MIQIENLSKNFGPFAAVKNIKFNIKKGEVVGLLGPNGAGKTTTMRMLTGFYNPSGGSIIIGGLNIDENKRDIQKMIGYLPESASSYTDMLVGDFLHFIAEARNMTKENTLKGIDKAVNATSLQQYYYRPISQLSKGFKQRVGLAAALIHDPEILILDEPTAGLDPNQILEIQNLIRSLAESKTIILSTHILKEVEATCKRAIIINEGKIIKDAPLSELQSLREGQLKLKIGIKGNNGNIGAEIKEKFSDAFVETLPGQDNETHVIMTSKQTKPEDIFQFAVARGWTLTELSPEKLSLENVFQTLTGAAK